MSTLPTLKDKGPKDAVKLLSFVSSQLLPHPDSVGEVINHPDTDSEHGLVQDIIREIRDHLRIPDDDHSAQTQSRIYAFLSDEISKAALANVDMNVVKARLGSKGELHASQYQVGFSKDFEASEALGVKKSHVVTAVTQPDQATHLRSKYISQDPLITISFKSVITQRIEDRFILLVFSNRKGRFQQVFGAFRAYRSDMDLTNITEPLDVIRSFAKTYGLTFRLGGSVSNCMINEVVKREQDAHIFTKGGYVHDDLELLGLKGTYYLPLILHGSSHFKGAGGEVLTEVFLAFMIDLQKYTATLRKHHVQLAPETDWRFPTI